MKKIYKYPLAAYGETFIEMPTGATVLSVQVQRGNLMLWALIDTYQGIVPTKRKFAAVFTGEAIASQYFQEGSPIIWKYIGTAQNDSGLTVVHVFEEIVYHGANT
jgi:hypothetical protein